MDPDEQLRDQAQDHSLAACMRETNIEQDDGMKRDYAWQVEVWTGDFEGFFLEHICRIIKIYW